MPENSPKRVQKALPKAKTVATSKGVPTTRPDWEQLRPKAKNSSTAPIIFPSSSNGSLRSSPPLYIAFQEFLFRTQKAIAGSPQDWDTRTKKREASAQLRQNDLSTRGIPILSAVFRALRQQQGGDPFSGPDKIQIKRLGDFFDRKGKRVDDLFILERTGGAYTASPSYGLAHHRDLLLRGHTPDDHKTANLEDALLLLAYLKTYPSERYGGEERSAIEKQVMSQLAEEIGEFVLNSYIAETKERSELESDKAMLVLKKALSGIVRMHHHVPTRNTGKKINRALVAIQSATDLCAELKRLPTKAEMRLSMEGMGWIYSEKSKDIPGQWRGLFNTAGLESLPD